MSDCWWYSVTRWSRSHRYSPPRSKNIWFSFAFPFVRAMCTNNGRRYILTVEDSGSCSFMHPMSAILTISCYQISSILNRHHLSSACVRWTSTKNVNIETYSVYSVQRINGVVLVHYMWCILWHCSLALWRDVALRHCDIAALWRDVALRHCDIAALWRDVALRHSDVTLQGGTDGKSTAATCITRWRLPTSGVGSARCSLTAAAASTHNRVTWCSRHRAVMWTSLSTHQMCVTSCQWWLTSATTEGLSWMIVTVEC